MIEFFSKLFNTDDFPARWNCGTWTEGHGWLHIISDLGIFTAYFAIPLALIYFTWKKRTQLPFQRIFLLFCSFILLCGLTHLTDASLFYRPHYRFAGVLKLITAIVSWWTVFALIGILPEALKIPGIKSLNERLKVQIKKQEESDRRLKRINADLSSFASIVAHDVKTPIASAVMYSGLAQEATEKGDLEENRAMMKRLSKTLESAATLIEDIETYSNSDVDFEIEIVDLASVFENVQNALQKPISETESVIRIGKMPVVMGNQSALQQVCSNIVHNAIKYRKEGKPALIKVESKGDCPNSPDRTRISISDDGIGISDKDHRKVFMPLMRLKEKKGVEGNGLGLAVANRLLGKMNGQISLESEEGKGSTFFIDLPKA